MACVDDQTAQRWTEDKRLGVCLGSEAGRPDLATVATQIRDAVFLQRRFGTVGSNGSSYTRC